VDGSESLSRNTVADVNFVNFTNRIG